MKTIEPFTPIQYVMGSTEFCGLPISVDQRVLIPRPETEILAEMAIEHAGLCSAILRQQQSRPCDALRIDAEPVEAAKVGDVKILDLCTGSGCIAIALAEALTKGPTNCRIIASDISSDALSVARQNAVRNGVDERVVFIKSDLFECIDGEFDIIVSNPPYIARHEFPTLQEEVLREPTIALDGGEDGLEYYRRIIPAMHRHLRRGGCAMFEIGYGQRSAVCEIIEKSGDFKINRVKKDFNGIDRIVVAEWIN